MPPRGGRPDPASPGTSFSAAEPGVTILVARSDATRRALGPRQDALDALAGDGVVALGVLLEELTRLRLVLLGGAQHAVQGLEVLHAAHLAQEGLGSLQRGGVVRAQRRHQPRHQHLRVVALRELEALIQIADGVPLGVGGHPLQEHLPLGGRPVLRQLRGRHL
jgi:hypothetical protein